MFEAALGVLLIILESVLTVYTGILTVVPPALQAPFPINPVFSEAEELDITFFFPQVQPDRTILDQAGKDWRDESLPYSDGLPANCQELVILDYGYHRMGLLGVRLERYPAAADSERRVRNDVIGWDREQPPVLGGPFGGSQTEDIGGYQVFGHAFLRPARPGMTVKYQGLPDNFEPEVSLQWAVGKVAIAVVGRDAEATSRAAEQLVNDLRAGRGKGLPPLHLPESVGPYRLVAHKTQYRAANASPRRSCTGVYSGPDGLVQVGVTPSDLPDGSREYFERTWKTSPENLRVTGGNLRGLKSPHGAWGSFYRDGDFSLEYSVKVPSNAAPDRFGPTALAILGGLQVSHFDRNLPDLVGTRPPFNWNSFMVQLWTPVWMFLEEPR